MPTAPMVVRQTSQGLGRGELVDAAAARDEEWVDGSNLLGCVLLDSSRSGRSLV